MLRAASDVVSHTGPGFLHMADTGDNNLLWWSKDREEPDEMDGYWGGHAQNKKTAPTVPITAGTLGA